MNAVEKLEIFSYFKAMDYYYTLQGWIKGVNMPYAGDPGGDGMGLSLVGKDVDTYDAIGN